mmetsp:Transcript_23663/g.43947  ORF Transcript_23663/g.43947 Transcript_23663/m.43947 type:complete len:301 (-) Transcript_23663:9-911(-)
MNPSAHIFFALVVACVMIRSDSFHGELFDEHPSQIEVRPHNSEQSLSVSEHGKFTRENVSLLEGQHQMERTGFIFHCGFHQGGFGQKMRDAACQGCFAMAVALVQASRKRCTAQDDEPTLYNTFVNSWFNANGTLMHGKRKKTMFGKFCKDTVDGTKDGPAYCQSFLFEKDGTENGPGVPGDTMIKDIKCRILSKVGQALHQSRRTRLNHHVAEACSTEESCDLNLYAQGINEFCSQALVVWLQKMKKLSHGADTSREKCDCSPWRKLQDAAGGRPEGWIVHAAECTKSEKDPKDEDPCR